MEQVTCGACEEQVSVLIGVDEHNGQWGLCDGCLRDLVDSGEWVNQGGAMQRAVIRAMDAGLLD